MCGCIAAEGHRPRYARRDRDSRLSVHTSTRTHILLSLSSSSARRLRKDPFISYPAWSLILNCCAFFLTPQISFLLLFLPIYLESAFLRLLSSTLSNFTCGLTTDGQTRLTSRLHIYFFSADRAQDLPMPNAFTYVSPLRHFLFLFLFLHLFALVSIFNLHVHPSFTNSHCNDRPCIL